MRYSSSSRTSARSARSASIGATATSASSAIEAARAIRASSPSSFTRRRPAIVRSSGSQVEVAARSIHAAWVRCVASARTGPSPAHSTSSSRSFGRVVRGDDLGVEPGGGEVGGGLFAVAAVGDEHIRSGRTTTQPSEPPNDVSQRMFDGVDTSSVSPVRARAHASGRERSRSAGASRHGRTPAGRRRHGGELVAEPPKPTIDPFATGATTLVWRHASRAFGLEMCSSTIGPSNAASASWRLQA